MNAQGQRRRSPGLVVVALLALAQGVLGLLRALQWIQIGSDLIRQGVVLLPIIGAMAFGRAVLAALVAALYGLFACGLLARRGWARPLGLTVALVNLVIVGLALVGGELPGRALLWAIAPLIIASYLLGPASRDALGSKRGGNPCKM
jgi:hypothetical protein